MAILRFIAFCQNFFFKQNFKLKHQKVASFDHILTWLAWFEKKIFTLCISSRIWSILTDEMSY